MTDEATVTQADRNAAADQFRYLGTDMKAMREGEMDGRKIVQKFARHRIAAEQSQAARIFELEATVSRLTTELAERDAAKALADRTAADAIAEARRETRELIAWMRERAYSFRNTRRWHRQQCRLPCMARRR